MSTSRQVPSTAPKEHSVNRDFAGLLDDPARMTVAITRAKRKLILISCCLDRDDELVATTNNSVPGAPSAGLRRMINLLLGQATCISVPEAAMDDFNKAVHIA
ncbi:unnamed protein product [Protopolystoma xenopodis]|uniref:Uncharacterized protein n=1 Tax=Protopolystoma xenopodis TaxID=117903 RepID=A0A448WFL0_9PLAT|nr:unnamed protein product [Protopolystoma xenopodis]